MRILALFDADNAEVQLKLLCKSKHQMQRARSIDSTLKKLQQQIFDLILCQAIFESGSASAYDLLKAVRQSNTQSDVPFICCYVNQSIELSAPEDVASKLSVFGGQGYVDSKTFHSRNLEFAIDRCMHRSVGKTCTVKPLYEN